MAKLHIKKGDNVVVIAGEHKGEQGTVNQVIRSKNRAIVGGVNMVTKHQKPSASNPQGGRIEEEAGIHISNLMVVDPKSGEATRIGRKLNENGKLVRYAKNSGEVIQ